MTNAGHYIIIIQHYDSILSNYLLTSFQWLVLPQQRWMSRTPDNKYWVEIIKIRHLMPQKKSTARRNLLQEQPVITNVPHFLKVSNRWQHFILSKFWLLATKIQPGENESYKCSKYQLQHFELSKCLNHSNSHTEEEREKQTGEKWIQDIKHFTEERWQWASSPTTPILLM